MAQNNGRLKNNFITCPDPDNLYEWYYIVFNLIDSPYEGGFYLGKLDLKGYPFQPPKIQLITQSGRFEPGKPICLSVSNFHTENWHPMWKISYIISGFITFMLTEDGTVGSIRTSLAHRRDLALRSKESIR